ncbi:hypothetical protein ACT4UL_28905 [Bacillus sp. HC-TM]
MKSVGFSAGNTVDGTSVTLGVLSTPLTTAQTMTMAAVAGNNTAKDEKADDLNEDVTASLSALFAMLPGFDNTPKVSCIS